MKSRGSRRARIFYSDRCLSNANGAAEIDRAIVIFRTDLSTRWVRKPVPVRPSRARHVRNRVPDSRRCSFDANHRRDGIDRRRPSTGRRSWPDRRRRPRLRPVGCTHPDRVRGEAGACCCERQNRGHQCGRGHKFHTCHGCLCVWFRQQANSLLPSRFPAAFRRSLRADPDFASKTRVCFKFAATPRSIHAGVSSQAGAIICASPARPAKTPPSATAMAPRGPCRGQCPASAARGPALAT